MFVCSVKCRVGVMLRDPSLTLLSHLLIIGAACNRNNCTYGPTFKHKENQSLCLNDGNYLDDLNCIISEKVIKLLLNCN